MRLLIAAYHLNVIGGTEKYLQALLPALARRGHELALVSERALDPALERINASALSIPTHSLSEEGLDGVLQFAAAWNPDVVYLHGMARADFEQALVDRFPTALFAHNYYGTCATGSKCFSFPQIRPCTRRFGRACLVLHYPRRCGGLNPLIAWRTYQFQLERYHLLPRYFAVFVAGEHMRQEFLRHGVDPEKLHIAPLPLANESGEQPDIANRVPEGRILFLGRITAIKGVRQLIQAAEKAAVKMDRPLTLTVAGEGPEVPRLRQMAKESLVAIEFAGWVHEAQKQELFARTDILAAPSLWPEPFGLVGLEAGSRGIPAVAYANGGIPGWLIPGVSGELAPGDPPTVDGLADALVRALADPVHYQNLCRGAWNQARRFSMEAHLAALEPVLASAQKGSLMNR